MKTSSAMRLDAAFQQERQFLKFRFGAQAVIAASFALLVGPVIAAAWLAACVAYGFMAAHWLHGPARRWLDERTWALAGLGHIGLGVALNGAIAVLAAARAGVWGVLNGELLLLCLLLNAATMARASRGAFFAALIPLLILMASLAPIAFHITPSLAGVSCLVVGTLFLFVNAVTVHRWSLRAAIEVERARDVAEAATEAKSTFIAIVSHELRTPLSGILAGATQLQASTEGTAARQAGLIADSGQLMRTLLNDLLDLSKLEAGRMDVEQIPFDLRKLLSDTLLFWRPQTLKAGLRLRVVGGRGAPHWVEGDPTRIRQILNNLISNALKFTREGGVTLEVSWRPGRQAGDLEIAVRDTGSGVDTTQLGKLFRPFEQLSTSTARTHGGTGLGLTISRRLAHAMRGQLTVESQVGHGSRFALLLPLTLCEAPTEDNAEETDASLRVLVADDHPVNREAARLILEPLVREFACVEDGAQALAVLNERPFDLIILDINMPVMGGIETARAIRLHPGPNRDTPLMALTGAVSESEIALCREAGFASVAAKPIQVQEVIEAMNRALMGAGGPDRTAQTD